MRSLFVSLSVVGCMVVACGSEAQAQLFRRTCPPQPCYQPTYLVYQAPTVVIYQVPTVTTYAQTPIADPLLWEGDLIVTQGHSGGISGTLSKQDGEQVTGFFRATEAASTAAQLGGPGKYRVRVQNKLSYGSFRLEKTWLIMEVIDQVPTVQIEQQIETYQPRLKAPTRTFAPAPLPPKEEPTVVQPRQVPKVEEAPPLQTPDNNDIYIPEADPQGMKDNSIDKDDASKPAFRNPKIAVQKKAAVKK